MQLYVAAVADPGIQVSWDEHLMLIFFQYTCISIQPKLIALNNKRIKRILKTSKLLTWTQLFIIHNYNLGRTLYMWLPLTTMTSLPLSLGSSFTSQISLTFFSYKHGRGGTPIYSITTLLDVCQVASIQALQHNSRELHTNILFLDFSTICHELCPMFILECPWQVSSFQIFPTTPKYLTLELSIILELSLNLSTMVIHVASRTFFQNILLSHEILHNIPEAS